MPAVVVALATAVATISAAPRPPMPPTVYLFAPALPANTDQKLSEPFRAAVMAIGRLLRKSRAVVLADAPDGADVVVEVWPSQPPRDDGDSPAAPHATVRLSVSNEHAHVDLLAIGARPKDADSQACEQLLAWIYDHEGEPDGQSGPEADRRWRSACRP
jgi:hypothetical protein